MLIINSKLFPTETRCWMIFKWTYTPWTRYEQKEYILLSFYIRNTTAVTPCLIPPSLKVLQQPAIDLRSVHIQQWAEILLTSQVSVKCFFFQTVTFSWSYPSPGKMIHLYLMKKRTNEQKRLNMKFHQSWQNATNYAQIQITTFLPSFSINDCHSRMEYAQKQTLFQISTSFRPMLVQLKQKFIGWNMCKK